MRKLDAVFVSWVPKASLNRDQILGSCSYCGSKWVDWSFEWLLSRRFGDSALQKVGSIWVHGTLWYFCMAFDFCYSILVVDVSYTVCCNIALTATKVLLVCIGSHWLMLWSDRVKYSYNGSQPSVILLLAMTKFLTKLYNRSASQLS